MTELRLFQVLQKDLSEIGVLFAIAGGIGVSTRAEPRFTRDLDLACAVESDQAAEQLVHTLIARGYEVGALVEQEVEPYARTSSLLPMYCW